MKAWVAVSGPVMQESLPDVLQGTTERRNRLIQEHLRRVFMLVYRIVGNVDDAQDLTQEVFIKALQRGSQLKDPAKAAQWLSRIATNTAIDFLRRRARAQLCDVTELAQPLAAPVAERPDWRLLQSERSSLLEEGLQVLTERERLALVLRDLEGLPASEVARRLNCSKATVRSHIANARVKFRRFLEAKGL